MLCMLLWWHLLAKLKGNFRGSCLLREWLGKTVASLAKSAQETSGSASACHHGDFGSSLAAGKAKLLSHHWRDPCGKTTLQEKTRWVSLLWTNSTMCLVGWWHRELWWLPVVWVHVSGTLETSAQCHSQQSVQHHMLLRCLSWFQY